MRKIDTIVIHCSATPEGRPVSVDTIRRWHLDRGWSDIGYHYVVHLNGRVETGRPLAVKGAHVAGHNATSIGICYVGGVTADGKMSPKDTRTPQQKQALEALLFRLLGEYPSINRIMGHRDFPGVKKACPCFDAIPEYAWMLKGSARQRGSGHAETVDTIKPAFPPDEIREGDGLVVPETVEREVKKRTTVWQWLISLIGSGGLGLGWLSGVGWQQIAAAGGVLVCMIALILLLRREVVLIVREIRKELEQ